MSQHAWLTAPIEIAKGVKTTRVEQLDKKGLEPSYPVVEEAPHILEWLKELGFCSSGGMGLVRLSFAEIESWRNLTRTSVTPDEVLILRQLSNLFCSKFNKADKNDIQPYSNEVTDDEAVEIQEKLRAARRSRRSK